MKREVFFFFFISGFKGFLLHICLGYGWLGRGHIRFIIISGSLCEGISPSVHSLMSDVVPRLCTLKNPHAY